jgi:hypothetical protein
VLANPKAKQCEDRRQQTAGAAKRSAIFDGCARRRTQSERGAAYSVGADKGVTLIYLRIRTFPGFFLPFRRFGLAQLRSASKRKNRLLSCHFEAASTPAHLRCAMRDQLAQQGP